MSALSSRPLLVFGLVVVAGIGVWAAASVLIKPNPVFVSERACEDSAFSCVTINVPRDHFNPGGPTWEVSFAIQRALSGTRDGVIVIATGGPGSSGIAVADDYSAYFDAEIPERYDIVFFDQRGIGRSRPLQCPEAAVAWYSSPIMPTVSGADAEAYAGATESFVADCLEETGVDHADLPYFSTEQASEDLEVFLDWLGAEQIDLYGESYGTQYAQVFAAAHPERIQALLLDGSVDLTVDGTDYHVEATHAHADTLAMILDLCWQDSACQTDFGGEDPLDSYDALVSALQDGPMTYDFVTDEGVVETREFSWADLETAVADNVTPTYWRMLLQRALAQAARGELLPLARLDYLALGQNADTLTTIPDPTWSDALYYAVDCTDYAFGSGSAADRADEYLAAGEDAGVADLRLGSVYYGNLPCAYWPVHGPEERPAYLTDTSYPVFVLAATADPATPYAGSERIVAQLEDPYFIVQPGGPHVIYLRGNPCPDDVIAAFLLDGTLPERETTCDLPAVEPYVPIPAADVSDYDSTLDALSAVDDEINNNADFWDWDLTKPLTYGCQFGGTISYRVTDQGYEVTLDDCAFSRGLDLTGDAVINDAKFSFSLTAQTGDGSELTYERDGDGERTATGNLP
ncbi:MAG TPA: alpha/beta hydrolase [Candidatus Limnocylindria bacterium]|nr:alpha/beta hydrolase [Candidatus Limnocylindria bacterium]